MSPLKYAEQWFKSSFTNQKLYSQTATGNSFHIEDSRLVDKEVEIKKMIHLENAN